MCTSERGPGPGLPPATAPARAPAAAAACRPGHRLRGRAVPAHLLCTWFRAIRGARSEQRGVEARMPTPVLHWARRFLSPLS